MLNENEISLKLLDNSHIDSIHKYLNNEKLAETYPVALPYSKDDAKLYVEKEINERKKGNRFAFAIEFKNQFVGICALYDVNINNKKAGIYYWIAVPFWNNGLATYALKKIIRYARKELQLEILKTGVLKRNQASIKVLKKNGFIKENIAKNPNSYHRKFEGEEILEMILKLNHQ